MLVATALLALGQLCDDTSADNYNRQGACQQPPTLYCGDSTATNYDAVAIESTTLVPASSVCDYHVVGCMDSTATNYLPNATMHNATVCDFPGCTNPASANYNATVSCLRQRPSACPLRAHRCAQRCKHCARPFFQRTPLTPPSHGDPRLTPNPSSPHPRSRPTTMARAWTL